MTSIALKPTSNPLAAAEREAILRDPGFGRHFTDHMVTIAWTEGRGWHDGQLVPYAPLSLDPAVMVLHYGQAIFEGLKAYRRVDGSIATFRPDANARRFQRSARRLAMPELPEDLFVASIEALVGQDHEWVPSGAERSLYLRPYMFSTEVGLGVRPANSYLYVLIASPAGPYFPRGLKPVTVWLSEDYTRAAPGGTGEAKCAGNYAASLVAQAQAAAQGCDQVVWLDAIEHRYVEEMGGMNIFFVVGSGADVTLVTPALNGRAAARCHPGLPAQRGARARLRCGGTPHLHGGVAGRQCVGRDHRGVRVRYGGCRHADRARQGRRPRMDDRRR